MAHYKRTGTRGARVAKTVCFIITLVLVGAIVASCAGPGENNLPCGVACGPDQVVHCGMCVTPIEEDHPCSQWTCTPLSVCDSGSCVNTSSGWVCKDVGNGGLMITSECDPSQLPHYTGIACPANTWCRDGQCMPGPETGRCTLLNSHGDFCNDDLHHLPPYGCVVCTHNSTCVSGMCLADCGNAADCPCDDMLDPYECEGGHCLQCRDWGETCDPPMETCCAGPDLECFAGTCCRSIGGSCSTDAECCYSSTLCLQGVCTPCQELGEDCTLGAGECCADAPVCADPDQTGPTCYPPCDVESEDGLPCDTLLPGQCNEGTIVCIPDRVGGGWLWTCVPNQGPSPEVCDGVDNDCDGFVDNNLVDVGGACSKFNPSGCNDPNFEAPGVEVCNSGNLECDIVGRFCGAVTDGVACNDTAIGPAGGYCGQCQNQKCVYPTSLCTPNMYCEGYDGTLNCGNVCYCIEDPDPNPTKCKPKVNCWMPADVGTCVHPTY